MKELEPMNTRLVRFLAVAPGVITALLVAVMSSGHTFARLGFALWVLVPFAVLALVVGRAARMAPIVVAGVLLSVCAGIMLWEVFFAPTSSTAALLLVFGPLWMLIIVLPVGLAGGWVLTRPRR